MGRKLTTLRERCVRIAEVEGSIPFESTNFRKITAILAVIFHLTTEIPQTDFRFDHLKGTSFARRTLLFVYSDAVFELIAPFSLIKNQIDRTTLNT